MSIWYHYIRGISIAFRYRRMVGLLFSVNLALASVLTMPWFQALKREFSHSLVSGELAAGSDVRAFISMAYDNPQVFSNARSMLVIAGLMYLVLNLALTGGMLQVLADRRGFSLRRFGQGAGAHFGLMARALVLSSFVVVLILIANRLVGLALHWPPVDARLSGVILQGLDIVRGIMLALALLAWNMIIDYARISAVLYEERSMVDCAFSAAKLCLRHLRGTFGLYLAFLATGGAVMASLLGLSSLLGSPAAGAIFAVFVLLQVSVFLRMALRVAFFGGQMEKLLDLTETIAP